VATFHNSLLNFLKPAWYSNFSKFSDSPVTIPAHLSGLCMMSAPCEKISKDKQGFVAKVIDRFGRVRRSLQLMFLSDADKYCQVK